MKTKHPTTVWEAIQTAELNADAPLSLHAPPDGLGPRGLSVEITTREDGERILVHNHAAAFEAKIRSRQSGKESNPRWWTSSWQACWKDFTALEGAADFPQAVHKFVSQYDMLGFCEHPPENVKGNTKPFRLRRSCHLCKEKEQEHQGELGEEGLLQHQLNRRKGVACETCDWREPLAAWECCVHQACAVVRIAAAVTTGERVRDSDGQAILGDRWEKDQTNFNLQSAKSTLIHFLDDWLQRGPISLVPAADSAATSVLGPQPALIAHTVLANLALQLTPVITSKTKVFTCQVVGCGVIVHDRVRGPRPGKIVRCEMHELEYTNSLKDESKRRRRVGR